MGKKKSSNGKGANKTKARPSSSSPSTKSVYVPKQSTGSDSSSGKVVVDFPPAIDAQTATPIVDLAMEIETPNLETLATVATVPGSTVPDITAEINTATEVVTETITSQDSQDPQGPSPALPTASPATPNPTELWKGFHLTVECSRYNRDKARGKAPIKSLLPIVPQTKTVYRPVGSKSTDALSYGETAALATRSPPPQHNSPPPPRRAKVVEDRQRSLSPATNQSNRAKSPLQSVPVQSMNLGEGGLVVDFTPYAVPQNSDGSLSSGHSSGHVSDGSNVSGDEDNPDDGNDKYIEHGYSSYQSLLGYLEFRGSRITVRVVSSSISSNRSKRGHLNSLPT
ncbi:Uncharacterized protein Rs2_17109 [Raphanus sativus]|nr:Uncharacterized protein Rs2_17109 [Raphanus sativus]